MPETAEYDLEDFDNRNSAAADERLLVKFFNKPLRMTGESEAKGRPVFKEVAYIDIKAAGDKEGVCRPATDDDKRRFHRHYTAFTQRTEIPETGHRLSEWAQITASQVQELAFFNVKTLEQLIHMSDQNAQNFMGINKLKAKAQAYLDGQNETVSSGDLQERDDKIEEQAAALELMKEQLNRLTAGLDETPEQVAASADAEPSADPTLPETSVKSRRRRPLKAE
jgi:hypothetical protein